jgi:hypothetical protein
MKLKKDIPQFLPMMGRKVQVYYRGITKVCINCYQPGHINKTCKNPSVGWIDYIHKFKEEHNFSDELYGNWIKILDLHKIRKEKKMQRKQHLEDVKKQREKSQQKTKRNQFKKRNWKRKTYLENQGKTNNLET